MPSIWKSSLVTFGLKFSKSSFVAVTMGCLDTLCNPWHELVQNRPLHLSHRKDSRAGTLGLSLGCLSHDIIYIEISAESEYSRADDAFWKKSEGLVFTYKALLNQGMAIGFT